MQNKTRPDLGRRRPSRRSKALFVAVLIALGFVGYLVLGGSLVPVGPKGSYGPSSTDCVGVAPSPKVPIHYTPPCYGHDEPTISFISSVADSGDHDSFQMVLPSSSSSYPQGYYYSAMWFGEVLYDTKSLDNQAFLELQLYPDSPQATGPGSGVQDCSAGGSFGYSSNGLSSNQWFACAIAWAVNATSGAEYAAIGLPVDARGGSDSILVMRSGDVLQFTMSGQAQSTSQGLQITISDYTARTSSLVALQNSSVVLSPFYSTAASGNVLQWGAAQPGQVSFAYEIGHSLSSASCGSTGSPGDGSCWSYWPGRWANSGQNQLFTPEMGGTPGVFPDSLVFSSSQGGDAEITSSTCHSPSTSTTTNCEYPYYMFLDANGAFTFGTIDVPGTSHDFGGASQFPSTLTVNTVAMISAVHANFVPPSGVYAENVNYTVGQEMLMSSIVPTIVPPVSVQAYINGTSGKVHPWDTTATGSNYIIDFGAAPNLPGKYYVYTVTIFGDGSTVRSSTDAVEIVA